MVQGLPGEVHRVLGPQLLGVHAGGEPAVVELHDRVAVEAVEPVAGLGEGLGQFGAFAELGPHQVSGDHEPRAGLGDRGAVAQLGDAALDHQLAVLGPHGREPAQRHGPGRDVLV
ncbi:hypothetical protein [Glycomyces tritici]|uniref:Uncharacterized protein n=1 Tax=Glycomyces tritici TaxID=2665176 RepID=A0ABT7YQA8_9ACTN|nr:hypothetical protein [Glycomyces tritici]MDN3240834.1 hypothetical protein [Glycomyces tritici]